MRDSQTLFERFHFLKIGSVTLLSSVGVVLPLGLGLVVEDKATEFSRVYHRLPVDSVYTMLP